jgi:hypothetical protein
MVMAFFSCLREPLERAGDSGAQTFIPAEATDCGFARAMVTRKKILIRSGNKRRRSSISA